MTGLRLLQLNAGLKHETPGRGLECALPPLLDSPRPT